MATPFTPKSKKHNTSLQDEALAVQNTDFSSPPVILRVVTYLVTSVELFK